MTSLYEIEPGVWIVPELVTSVTAVVDGLHSYYTSTGLVADHPRHHVEIHLLGKEKPVVVRYYNEGTVPPPEGGWVKRTPAEWYDIVQQDAREVTAWIDERRIEPLRIVSAL